MHCWLIDICSFTVEADSNHILSFLNSPQPDSQTFHMPRLYIPFSKCLIKVQLRPLDNVLKRRIWIIVMLLVVKILFALARPSSEMAIVAFFSAVHMAHDWPHSSLPRLTSIITTNDGFFHLKIPKASPSRLTLYHSHPLAPLIPLDETFKSLTMEFWCTNIIDFPSWLFKLAQPWATDEVCGSFSAPVNFSDSSWTEPWNIWKSKQSKTIETKSSHSSHISQRLTCDKVKVIHGHNWPHANQIIKSQTQTVFFGWFRISLRNIAGRELDWCVRTSRKILQDHWWVWSSFSCDFKITW